MSQDIIVGFDKAGIDIDAIISIQRKATRGSFLLIQEKRRRPR